MSYFIKPENYTPLLNVRETELGIKIIKDFFSQNLAAALCLQHISAPLFVESNKGLNDNLNGVENPVTFRIKDSNNTQAEIVHSLAKWKRLALETHQIREGYGIYTDMKAIRTDEILGNLHSVYVDQWDWERVMQPQERNLTFLKSIVRKIYAVIVRTEYAIYEKFPQIKPILPPDIHFLHTEDLLKKYPRLSAQEREHSITKELGAVFIIGVGGKLSNGAIHDKRAPDYDDWSTLCENGQAGLNGDVLVWHSVLNRSVELSSMGIRVDIEALLKQLKELHCEDRKELYFHKKLLQNELPQSIGGGIGQSRLSMFCLRKAHIGEVQASIWPQEMHKEANAARIGFL